MKWREVSRTLPGGATFKSCPGDVLPGPAFTLAVVFEDDGFFIRRRAADCVSFGTARAVRFESFGRAVEIEDSDGTVHVYRRAKGTKRGRLPVPAPPLLETCRAHQYDADCPPKPVHRVAEVREYPDPNRTWNTADALITAVCGYGGWIRPGDFNPVDGERCPRCYPS